MIKVFFPEFEVFETLVGNKERIGIVVKAGQSGNPSDGGIAMLFDKQGILDGVSSKNALSLIVGCPAEIPEDAWPVKTKDIPPLIVFIRQLMEFKMYFPNLK